MSTFGEWVLADLLLFCNVCFVQVTDDGCKWRLLWCPPLMLFRVNSLAEWFPSPATIHSAKSSSNWFGKPSKANHIWRYFSAICQHHQLVICHCQISADDEQFYLLWSTSHTTAWPANASIIQTIDQQLISPPGASHLQSKQNKTWSSETGPKASVITTSATFEF